MSTPRNRRSQRGSVSGTPKRSARNTPSSAPVVSSPQRQDQGVPRASNQNVHSSSPLFFRSSPVNGAANSNSYGRMEISSPLRQASNVGDDDVTPQGRSRPPNGTNLGTSHRSFLTLGSDSSPIRYVPSSSPTRAANGNNHHQSNIPSSSSGLFVCDSRSSVPGSSGLNNSKRGDIHSEIFGASTTRRNRMIVDENGIPVGDNPQSDSRSFSNLDPNTSEADALGGSSTRTIWGTNISLQDTVLKFKDFLLGYQKKYRMWADGASEEETSDPNSGGNEKVYMEMLKNMLHLGVTSLNLDIRNLKAYPSTVKLWHQIQAYPHEIVPIMDQSVKDLMVDLAEAEMSISRTQLRLSQQNRARQGSSLPPVPSSDMSGSRNDERGRDDVPDLVQEVEIRVYKVKPFGLDNTINMRELDPNGIEAPCKLVPMISNEWNRYRQTDQH